MLRTPQFYVLYAMFVMMATGGLLVTANAGPIAKSVGHPGDGARAGDVAQRAGQRRQPDLLGLGVRSGSAASIAMGIAFRCRRSRLVLVLTVGRMSGTLFTVTLVLTFFTWGEIFSLFPSLVADYYGTRHATANYGVMYSAKGVASIIAGGIAAMLFERFGSWTACFYGSAVLALLAAGLIFGLRSSTAAAARPAGGAGRRE